MVDSYTPVNLDELLEKGGGNMTTEEKIEDILSNCPPNWKTKPSKGKTNASLQLTRAQTIENFKTNGGSIKLSKVIEKYAQTGYIFDEKGAKQVSSDGHNWFPFVNKLYIGLLEYDELINLKKEVETTDSKSDKYLTDDDVIYLGQTFGFLSQDEDALAFNAQRRKELVKQLLGAIDAELQNKEPTINDMESLASVGDMEESFAEGAVGGDEEGAQAQVEENSNALGDFKDDVAAIKASEGFKKDDNPFESFIFTIAKGKLSATDYNSVISAKNKRGDEAILFGVKIRKSATGFPFKGDVIKKMVEKVFDSARNYFFNSLDQLSLQDYLKDIEVAIKNQESDIKRTKNAAEYDVILFKNVIFGLDNKATDAELIGRLKQRIQTLDYKKRVGQRDDSDRLRGEDLDEEDDFQDASPNSAIGNFNDEGARENDETGSASDYGSFEDDSDSAQFTQGRGKSLVNDRIRNESRVEQAESSEGDEDEREESDGAQPESSEDDEDEEEQEGSDGAQPESFQDGEGQFSDDRSGDTDMVEENENGNAQGWLASDEEDGNREVDDGLPNFEPSQLVPIDDENNNERLGGDNGLQEDSGSNEDNGGNGNRERVESLESVDLPISDKDEGTVGNALPADPFADDAIPDLGDIYEPSEYDLRDFGIKYKPEELKSVVNYSGFVQEDLKSVPPRVSEILNDVEQLEEIQDKNKEDYPKISDIFNNTQTEKLRTLAYRICSKQLTELDLEILKRIAFPLEITFIEKADDFANNYPRIVSKEHFDDSSMQKVDADSVNLGDFPDYDKDLHVLVMNDVRIGVTKWDIMRLQTPKFIPFFASIYIDNLSRLELLAIKDTLLGLTSDYDLHMLSILARLFGTWEKAKPFKQDVVPKVQDSVRTSTLNYITSLLKRTENNLIEEMEMVILKENIDTLKRYADRFGGNSRYNIRASLEKSNDLTKLVSERTYELDITVDETELVEYDNMIQNEDTNRELKHLFEENEAIGSFFDQIADTLETVSLNFQEYADNYFTIWLNNEEEYVKILGNIKSEARAESLGDHLPDESSYITFQDFETAENVYRKIRKVVKSELFTGLQALGKDNNWITTNGAESIEFLYNEYLQENDKAAQAAAPAPPESQSGIRALIRKGAGTVAGAVAAGAAGAASLVGFAQPTPQAQTPATPQAPPQATAPAPAQTPATRKTRQAATAAASQISQALPTSQFSARKLPIQTSIQKQKVYETKTFQKRFVNLHGTSLTKSVAVDMALLREIDKITMLREYLFEEEDEEEKYEINYRVFYDYQTEIKSIFDNYNAWNQTKWFKGLDIDMKSKFYKRALAINDTTPVVVVSKGNHHEYRLSGDEQVNNIIAALVIAVPELFSSFVLSPGIAAESSDQIAVSKLQSHLRDSLSKKDKELINVLAFTSGVMAEINWNGKISKFVGQQVIDRALSMVKAIGERENLIFYVDIGNKTYLLGEGENVRGVRLVLNTNLNGQLEVIIKVNPEPEDLSNLSRSEINRFYDSNLVKRNSDRDYYSLSRFKEAVQEGWTRKTSTRYVLSKLG